MGIVGRSLSDHRKSRPWGRLSLDSQKISGPPDLVIQDRVSLLAMDRTGRIRHQFAIRGVAIKGLIALTPHNQPTGAVFHLVHWMHMGRAFPHIHS
jgi:hypothetical protein